MTDRDPTVAIIGSRNYPHLDHPRLFVQRLAHKYPGAVVVSGGASGVDQAAEQEADTQGLGVISYRTRDTDHGVIVDVVYNTRSHYLLGDTAIDYCCVLADGNWKTTKQALLARNHMIVDTAEQVVAFWTTWSKGTLHAINYARKTKKPLHINPFGEPKPIR